MPTAVICGAPTEDTIARQVACAFAQAGYDLLVIAGSKGRAAAVAPVAEAAGVQLVARACKYTDADQLPAIVDEAAQRLGSIDVLVNCQQAAKTAAFDKLTAADFELSVQSGLMFAIASMQACHLHLATSRGIVINLVSAGVHAGEPGFAAIAASKGGLEALSRVVAAEWADEGIDVHCVAPQAYTALSKRIAQETGVEASALLGDQTEDAGLVCLRLVENGVA